MKGMFEKPRARLRIILPIAIVLAWLAAGGIGGPYFGKIDEVSSNDLSTFLPASAESTKVKDELGKFEDSDTLPAIVVFESHSVLTSRQKDAIASAKTKLQDTGVVKGEASDPMVAGDGKAEFIIVPLDSNSEFDTAIAKLQNAVEAADTGVQYKMS